MGERYNLEYRLRKDFGHFQALLSLFMYVCAACTYICVYVGMYICTYVGTHTVCTYNPTYVQKYVRA